MRFLPYPFRRAVRVLAVLALALAVPAALAPAQQPALARDPDAARLVTDDVVRFWRVHDAARLGDAGHLLQTAYLDSGSVGLRDFAATRIRHGRLLAATVAAHPRYYAAVRANTLALSGSRAITDSIRAIFRRTAAEHPEARFPDVYFVVGRINSGGTVSRNGLLIGTEMYATDAATPLDELGDWERANVHALTDLPYLVAHELMHFQQAPDTGRVTLLRRALREGAADFLSERVAGGIINRPQHVYGDAHEAALWREFREAMHGTDVSRWLYGSSRTADRPGDLGYYVGYKIAEAYYRRATDKAAALRTLLRVEDAEAILRASGYGAVE
jgi:hypothetical protein